MLTPSAPDAGQVLPALASPGRVLALVARGAAETRADIARLTGLARSTVSQRVDLLIEHGFLDEAPDVGASGRRLPRRLRLRTRDQLVVGIGLGATHCRVALLDVGGQEVVSREEPLLISDGPEAVLEATVRTARALLAESGRSAASVRAVGAGVPGPVEFATGRPVDPPIMPGWHLFPIPQYLAERLGASALVDNDVNVMALAERHWVLPDVQHLLFVKVGTGIGSGVLAGGRLHRGAQGSAGDIGHIRVGADDAPCRCGNTGCLEAFAGGAALARRLTASGVPAATAADVARLVAAGDRTAVPMVREAGRRIGNVLSSLITFFNPEAIVFGGALSSAHELLAGVREAVYERSHPLATQYLRIAASGTRENAVARGAGLLAIDHALSPCQVDGLLDAHAAPTGAAP
ncbi:ROK family transcriptional regulator [Streptomyces sp. NPDC049879]|uniref:ROK family transcriptional regulator n=1 Tax=Streptomyces sp. NPDC049879 TaxID=3365598 RepID=UPI0037945452